ncbi:hypothetical protein Bca52824_046500 [Brassica carinata]|uniref:Uncharacterized protein n=1 Tax=Brassica carinata TaxID=52824 RepID=A0A8X7USH7_BRACI|nr:hypothetical protein Bca52824_046500 [Brassica carinata]
MRKKALWGKGKSCTLVTLPAFQRCLEDGPDAAERQPEQIPHRQGTGDGHLKAHHDLQTKEEAPESRAKSAAGEERGSSELVVKPRKLKICLLIKNKEGSSQDLKSSKKKSQKKALSKNHSATLLSP